MFFTRVIVCSLTLLASVSVAYAQIAANDRPKERRDYFADVRVYSIVPAKGIDSVQGSGTGGVGPGGTFGTFFSKNGRDFGVTVNGRWKDSRFTIVLTIEPRESDRVTEQTRRTFDMTDLSMQSFEVGRDDDGRVYRVDILPRIVRHPAPKQLDPANLGLDRFSFQRSQVVLNRQDLLGEMNMRGGTIAHIDVPGLAMVEFSLRRFKDASPEGQLKEGTITITHEDEHLAFHNVRTGDSPVVLPGGPYTIWVRWKAPSQTTAEYKESLKQQLPILKAKIAAGSLNPQRGMIERLEKSIATGRVVFLTCGVRNFRASDAVK
ncbi:MAG: hypothetical protein AAGD07_25255 [Planctomycetota bacterium]